MGFKLNHQRRRKSLRRAKRSGVAVVELALVAPLLFLFLFAAIDIARANSIRSTAENAAYEGARASVIPGATPEKIEAATREILDILSIDDAVVSITPATITSTTPVVTVRVDIPLASNLYASSNFLTSVTISRSCALSRENFSVETTE